MVLGLFQVFSRSLASSIMSWQNIGGVWGFRSLPVQVLSGTTWYQATESGFVFMTLVNGRYDWAFRRALSPQAGGSPLAVLTHSSAARISGLFLGNWFFG